MADKGKPIGNMKFGLGIDGTKELGNTLDQLTKQFKQAESAMKANVKAFDGAGNSVEALEQKYSDLTDVVKIQEKRIDVLNKRRDEAIKKYGAESKQVQSLNTQINNQTARYNALNSQLQKTGKEYIESKAGVTDLTKAIKDNERETAQQVKALKDAGDSAGAYEAKQEGLKKQVQLTEKAVEAQRRAVEMMADEFGQSSKEVKEAEQALSKMEGQAKLSAKALKSIEDAGDGIEGIKDGAEGASGGVGDLLGSLTLLGGGAIAAAIGAVTAGIAGITDGLGDAIDLSNKLQAGLGITAEGAEFVGKQADNMIATGIAESYEEATDAIIRTQQATKDLRFEGEYTIGQYSADVLSFSKAFDSDFNETLRGSNQLMRTFGLTGKDALDLMALGAQNGLNSTDELADNLAEYAPQFEEMGFSATEMFDLLAGGMANGAYNLDKVNDLINETNTAFADGRIGEQIGNFSQETQDLFKAWQNGEASQSDVFKSLIADFQGIEDQTKKATIAGAIWSSLGEDNALSMIDGITSLDGAYSEFQGTMDGVNDAMGNTTAWQALMSTFTVIKKTIGDALLPYIGKFTEAIEGIASDANMEKLQTFFSDVFGKISDFLKPAIEYIKVFAGIAGEMFGQLIDVLYPKLKPILDRIFEAFQGIFKSLTDFWNQYGQQIMAGFSNFLKFISPLLDIAIGLLGDFVNNVIGMVEGLVETFQGLIKIFTGIFTGDWALMWDGIKQTFSGAIKTIWNWFQVLFFQKLMKGIKGLASGFGNTVKGMWTSVKNFFTQGIGSAWGAVKTWVSNLLTKGGELKTSFVNVIKNLWKGVKDTFSGGIDTVVGWIKNLPKQLADGINKGAHFLKDAFKNMFNGAMKAIAKPVNGIIGGANWVLDKLGMDEIKPWEPPQYAKGTPNGGHPGGMMMVNDGRGAEMVIDPSGQAVIPKGKNVTMYGRKGTQVLTAEETAQVLGHKRPKYAYKKGTGFFDNVKQFASGAFNKLKDGIGDIWEYASNPSKLVEKIFSSAVDLSGLVKYPLDVATGMVKKAKDGLFSKVEELFAGGNLDTSIGTSGVYKYLADVAKKVIQKFPDMRITSGYRAGDPYSHGSRNAIDVAFPASMNGSSKYREAGNYAFEKFKNQVGYVIALNKVRDRAGTSGTGIHDAWTNWASGGHMDHLHINGVKDPQSGGSGEDFGGSGVGRWRSTAIKALRMTGQYSTANLNALLNQMRTESNGNPRAINNWDSNAAKGTPSKGLMQVIDPTFQSYALKGYNKNIYDPLSNILASIRYTLSRYGSLTAGWRGVGYENGGLITREHLAMVGEGNKPEVVIPLDSAKRTRAMQLLALAQKKMGVSQNTIVAGGGTSDELLIQLLQAQQQTNMLLQALLEKDTDVYIDKRKVTAEIEPEIAKTKERKTMGSSRRRGVVS